ncbi:hypothetical protein FDP22_21780 (plasmid) [Paroceanicella profunda]|uniref:Uncharacterized protein n=1 Tax=Paroceanicella profunda TaxID=2579971 RepID=A0A5B8FJM5_9RHOB|nr:hypothetical protein [Paroceanicella profunda]QDL94498.1 hypothetical protein FDP22_21780 [Paroceanicella profunda]
MTDHTPSRALALFGTEEEVPPPRILAAGPLTAEFEAGNLRYIRFGGAEVLRAVSFIVRDRDWGTFAPALSDIVVEESGTLFTVTYAARAADGGLAFAWRARIEGHADGTLVFSSRGAAEAPFETNRTGFVILHPIDGVAGRPVEILHTDGRRVSGSFPALIDPVQPMMDLRELVHTTPGGLRVSCLMEGDTFEMEDQRNWTDASFKTYVRPLALPWPYRLEPGEELAQSVTVRVSGPAPRAAGAEALALGLGAPAGRVPPVGLGLQPEDVDPARAAAEALRALAPAHLICHHDPRRGHDRTSLAAQADLARALGAEPWLEAVIVSVDGFEAEIAALGAMVRGLGAPFATVLTSPAADLKCTLPGSPWPETPPAEALAQATRAAFPGTRIGGGMFSYFTELNRKRPPVRHLDLVSFTTTPLVHAGDDRSVTETLQALPAVAASAAALCAGVPFAVGPSAIGMRDNPYGAAPKPNPGNIRQAMNRNDPRQRGLLGAAWTLGCFAQLALGGASAVAFGAPVGPFGVLHAPAEFPQPWFDTHGGLFPVFHVLRGLSALEGRPLRALGSPRPELVQGLVADGGGAAEIWLANLTAAPLTLTLPVPVTAMAVLDAAGFAAAAADPAYMDALRPAPEGPIPLDAHAVLRLHVTIS